MQPNLKLMRPDDRLDNLLVGLMKWGVISALLILGFWFWVRRPEFFGVFLILMSIAFSSMSILLIRVSILDIKYELRRKRSRHYLVSALLILFLLAIILIPGCLLLLISGIASIYFN